MFKKFNQFNYSCFYVSNFLNKNCVIPNYSINTIHNYSTKYPIKYVPFLKTKIKPYFLDDKENYKYIPDKKDVINKEDFILSYKFNEIIEYYIKQIRFLKSKRQFILLQEYIESDLNLSISELINNKILIKDKGILFENQHELIKNNIHDCIKIINEFKKISENNKKNLKPLYELDEYIITYIIINNIVNLLYSDEGINKNTLLMKIGRDIYDTYLRKLYNKDLNKQISFREYKKSIELYNDTNISIIGDLILTLFINISTLIKSELIKEKNIQYNIIYASPEGEKYLLENIDIGYLDLPMICPPAKWNDDNENGGYICNKYLHDNLIHFNPEISIESEINKNIRNIIHKLELTPFRINKDFLEFIEQNGKSLNLLIDKHPDTNIKKTKEVISHNRQYIIQESILKIAKLYKDCDKIYFPLYLDFRGRIYTKPNYLNYQSNELAKALLEFSNGCNLYNDIDFKNYDESVKWLKIYGANCYGFNKKSYNERIKWVEDNENNILELNNAFINKANSPYLFIAFCLEYKKFLSNPNKFVTHLPIQLDATCNGIQHLALLSKNEILGKYVNILSSEYNELPNDLYNYIINYINDEIKKLIIEKPEYSNLNNLKLTRTIVKRPIMTISYNVTINGIVNHLSEHFNKIYENKKYKYILKDDNSIFLTTKEMFKLAQIIHKILFDVHPELKKLIEYLNNIVKLFNDLELPIIWTTPSGMIVKQKYIKFESHRIRNNLFYKSDYTIKIPSNKINLRKQSSGFMPNLIHSLDASVLHNLLMDITKENKNIFELYFIHDCFASTANNITKLNLLIRNVIINIYANNDYITNLHNNLISEIKNIYPVYNNIVIKDNIQYIIPEKPVFKEIKNLQNELLNAIYLIN